MSIFETPSLFNYWIKLQKYTEYIYVMIQFIYTYKTKYNTQLKYNIYNIVEISRIIIILFKYNIINRDILNCIEFRILVNLYNYLLHFIFDILYTTIIITTYEYILIYKQTSNSYTSS